ncbi:acetyl/propionyl/methylcrotonyl-CoA carboxylase subunit alpha [Motiliproteus coralliicola]|uniref:Biotin carboxylase n=1 Tax=Motiliproteus coralliicola TaxID=2283196 RepID=A0A369WTJ0_9GAMM|nr:acetyl/propionyl/methylcrotonyl-CoA carboxylase subunit alpha [Motiliproteus coralliicola]RDE24369.1 acetyl/propionyl/methylcrotonyl-CoA carboxylase subunit alpha [Motiliproteus coralliicola]
MNSIHKILIANRGEIAVRVIRTAKQLGYRTVAVYSDADADALHVQAADQAVHIGPSPVGESYLQADKLLDAAKRSQADAIHPGYGFLSENADFARACEAAGITFIGPKADAIELMGSKRLSKVAMIEADVPCIPGYQDSDQRLERLLEEAQRIGFPLMVKASSGGGGRGMRLVFEQRELEASIKTARSEAASAFGSDEMILERAVIEPRHIEIQVFADQQGNCVYLGERDCSIQRRHQKVVEEAPSPFVDEALRRRMGEAAVNAAKACHYQGAGTVEFLVDHQGNFYFLEMNTRLQVEHPVTELITGQDLVAWQIRVAAGEPLPLTQEQIQLQGHAMEVRLYAEDPRNNFMPQTGDVLRWELPQSEGVRIDHGIREGQPVSPHYDPLLAKIIAYGSNREEARRRLACAVEDTLLLGVNNNQRFLANILRHPVFTEGQATTAFIEQHFEADPSIQAAPPSERTLGLAALLMYTHQGRNSAHNPDLLSWRNCAPAPWHYRLEHEGEIYQLQLSVDSHGRYPSYQVTHADQSHRFEVLRIDSRECVYLENGVRETIAYHFDADTLHLNSEFGNAAFSNVTHAPKESKDSGSGRVLASMDGVIVDVLVQLGDEVSKGQTLVILEAMKMEHQLKADVDGVVESLSIQAGDQVKIRQLLASVTASATD